MTRVIDTTCEEAFDVLQIGDFAGQADHVIQDAHIQAKSIINDAKAIAKNLEREASERGYQEGFTRGKSHGYTDGRNQAKAEMETELKKQGSDLSELMQEILDKIKQASETQLNKQSTQIVDLGLLLAEKVVGHVSVNDISCARENMKKALELTSCGSQITVCVNPDQFDQLHDSLEEFAAVIDSHGKVKVVSDPSVNPGGVVVNTEGGRIDATVESQLETVKKAMLGIDV